MAVPPVFVSGQVLTAAQMNKIGLWQVKAKTSFSAATSITADNVFTSDFQDYLITCRFSTSTTNGLSYRNRVGGVSAATNYNYQDTYSSGTVIAAARFTAQTSHSFAGSSSTVISYVNFFVSGPQLAEATIFSMQQSQSGGAYNLPVIYTVTGNHSTATAYDGFEIFTSGGTTTGNYTVYGLRP